MERRRIPLALVIAACAIGCGRQSGGTPTAAEVPMQRLTPTEYNRTVQDLFGLDESGGFGGSSDEDEDEDEFESAGWPWRFPLEQKVEGFEGLAEGQAPSPYLIEQYQRAAAHFAPYSMRSSAFFVCRDFASGSEEQKDACARESLQRFAQRAWRRPTTDEEKARISGLYDTLRGSQSVENATIATVEGLLQTPQFLYRPAFGEGKADAQVRPLTSWELASRMSYFLWDTMPDRELFDAAADGKLTTDKQVRKQARRMLRDPKARQAVVHFHDQWLELDKLHRSNPDLSAHAPRYLPEIVELETPLFPEEKEEMWSIQIIGSRVALEHEAQRFVESTVFERNGTLAELLTGRRGYVSEIGTEEGEEPEFSTSLIYGEGRRGQRDSRVATSDGNIEYYFTTYKTDWSEAERSGVLTTPAWLMGEAHPVHPAPIFRGVFVMERMLCEPVGQPPPAAAGRLPPDSSAAEGTNRDRVEAITQDAECAACHDRINPLGFAFEHYDSLGGYRTTDNGQPVDGSGTYVTSQGDQLAFNNAVELVQQLSQLDQVKDCYAHHWTRYAVGHDVGFDDPRFIDIAQAHRDPGATIEDLLVEIVVSDLFRYREGGAE